MLTDSRCRSVARPIEKKRARLTDAGGLFLEISPAATKVVTLGPSLYFSMADKSLNRILQLMKELGLTPVHRVGTVRATSTEALEFEDFIAGP
jgi:hypothetical protein